MSVHKINSKVDNAIDASATSAQTKGDEIIISSLWDRTFCGYPPEMVVKLPYYFVGNYTQAAAAGPAISNQFKVNSLYDFDLTGVGHQPLGRDTWANIYDYYKVLETRVHTTHRSLQYITGASSRLTDNTITDSAGSSYFSPLFVGGVLDITASPPTTLTIWQEARMITSNSQERFSGITTLTQVGSRQSQVYHEMRWVPEMFDTAVINSATLNTWTAVGSDPANLNYYYDVVYNSAAGLTQAYQIEVKCEMLVAFKNVSRTLMHTTN